MSRVFILRNCCIGLRILSWHSWRRIPRCCSKYLGKQSSATLFLEHNFDFP
uniref:Uncharacterized protein n=1 Tax=Octopus bimaculoides TaxID=37653 RepID=A0A0L8IEL7_OCTBM